MAPAVAVNVAVVPSAATVTEAGTLKSELLLSSRTVAPPDAAAADSVTVQLEVAPAPRLTGEQPNELMMPAASSEIVVVCCELPL